MEPGPKSPFSHSSDCRPSSDQPQSATSSKFAAASTSRTVVTAPPWAKDEPDEENFLRPPSAIVNSHQAKNPSFEFELTPSDIASVTSSNDLPGQNSWWTFTHPRRKPASPDLEGHVEDVQAHPNDVEKGRPRRISRIRPQLKAMNRSSWFSGLGRTPRERDKEFAKEQENAIEETDDDTSNEENAGEDEERDEEDAEEERDRFDAAGPSYTVPPFPSTRSRLRRAMPRRVSSNVLRLDMPLPPAPFTKAQTETPGWDSPWNPQRYIVEPDQARTRDSAPNLADGQLSLDRQQSAAQRSSTSATASHKKRRSPWERRSRKLRKYFLHNLYVPLLFRFLNLVFTSGTLGIAVRIRRLERNYNVLGVLGSSATVSIVFAPETLLHVLIATWFEYFGRPVGLWRTSWKLSYTLIEVVLICAWAAALSLCFNDYLTTPLRCAPRSVNDWWNHLPESTNPLGNQMVEVQVGETLCDLQLALTCFAYVTLASYCSNLVISLFRIIEKVKFHSNRRPYAY